MEWKGQPQAAPNGRQSWHSTYAALCVYPQVWNHKCALRLRSYVLYFCPPLCLLNFFVVRS